MDFLKITGKQQKNTAHDAENPINDNKKKIEIKSKHNQWTANKQEKGQIMTIRKSLRNKPKPETKPVEKPTIKPEAPKTKKTAKKSK